MSPDRRPGRAFTVAAALAVVVLAAAAFTVTYEPLRLLARAGGVDARWAPAYPVIADTLLAVAILAVMVARRTRWWTRLWRWALLLALLAGGAALSVQHAVWGYASLPDDAVRAGVAVAPHVALVVVVLLWLTLVKQRRRVPEPLVTAPPQDAEPVEEAPREDDRAETVAADEPAEPPVVEPVADDEPRPAVEEPPVLPDFPAAPVDDWEPVTTRGPAPTVVQAAAREREEELAAHPSPDEAPPLPEPEPTDEPPLPVLEPREPEHERPPASLPTDVELVRSRPADADEAPQASTTRDDLPLWGWNPPPSGSLRSGPTPPSE
ncbi:DUF2637 domain-containing protein [Actinomadura flavalba]|uniref:DUF2637 domain-containing protein n=1 Tax=Actinomadura flavalba TaxID=1120938 RepID=UPI0003667A2B|nr:DUF2637 domain-containing protein [Actinomadura flavalba]